jgi:hypothetical protein
VASFVNKSGTGGREPLEKWILKNGFKENDLFENLEMGHPCPSEILGKQSVEKVKYWRQVVKVVFENFGASVHTTYPDQLYSAATLPCSGMRHSVVVCLTLVWILQV